MGSRLHAWEGLTDVNEAFHARRNPTDAPTDCELPRPKLRELDSIVLNLSRSVRCHGGRKGRKCGEEGEGEEGGRMEEGEGGEWTEQGERDNEGKGQKDSSHPRQEAPLPLQRELGALQVRIPACANNPNPCA